MSITNLPLEILSHLCEYLEPQEWGALRITCHQIHRKTLEAYSTRYFRSLSLLLTHEGLSRLEEVAESEALRGSVQEIWIIPNLFEGWPQKDKTSFKRPSLTHWKMRGLFRREPEESNDSQAEYEAQLDALFAVYEATIAEHRAILDSGLFEALEKCLPRLENAINIGLQCYPIDTLLREAHYGSFRCLGLRELKSQLNTPGMLSNLTPPQQFQHHMLSIPLRLAFSHLLNGIIKSSRKVQALHTCGNDAYPLPIRDNYVCGMTLGSLQLPESQYQLLLPLLCELTTLHMCIRIKDNKHDIFHEDTLKRLLNILITVAPKLKFLVFAQWIPMEELSPLYFQDLSQRIQFYQLGELHLHSIEVTVDALKHFLRTAAPTLKRLSLKKVNLVDAITTDPGPLTADRGTWGSSFSTEVVNEIRELWKQNFEFWADHLKLQFLQLSNLGYRGREIMLQDNLYTERGQLDAQPSTDPEESFMITTMSQGRPAEADDNPMDMAYVLVDFYFDAERASIPFKGWIMQLQIKMYPQGFGITPIPWLRGMRRFKQYG
ncbi:hypothetical protein N7478_010347 [Penicillium angulare]|uniref:uncharacterized protein n=1 Tax=Penicillium angulare TaxID=116970 RepID=UPI00254029A3|nr:uncharacterized protein N7478_010347 [Penicillium angulare]KAJ5267539.1 hypothetical protein N7478_010347 [Penicillium angulare]